MATKTAVILQDGIEINRIVLDENDDPVKYGAEWLVGDEIPSVSYYILRKAEYPPAEEYLDAIVKGDDAAVQAYIDACLAVKAKYPKS